MRGWDSAVSFMSQMCELDSVLNEAFNSVILEVSKVYKVVITFFLASE